MIVGSGSVSFEMIRDLTERIPMMVCPSWVYTRIQPIAIRNVLDYLVAALDKPASVGKIIEIGGPEKLEYLEILNIIKRVLGKSRMNFHIPMWVMKPIAACLEKIVSPAPITRDQLAMMEMGNTGDTDLMKKLFAIDPTSLEDGLRKYLG